MSKFKIGDRVRFIGQSNSTRDIAGKVGTVVCTRRDILCCGVYFDNKVPMCHDLAGLCKNNHGWWCYVDELELIIDEPRFNVIITSVGDTTTAKLLHGKKVEKEVSVKRYYKDKYSEQKAIEEVLTKLYGEDKWEKKPEPVGINCKAVCIDDDGFFLTRGKIYEFSDGRCFDNRGEWLPVLDSPKITEFNDPRFKNLFIKLVDEDEESGRYSF